MFYLFLDIVVLVLFLLGLVFMIFGNAPSSFILLLWAFPAGVGFGETINNLLMRK